MEKKIQKIGHQSEQKLDNVGQNSTRSTNWTSLNRWAEHIILGENVHRGEKIAMR